MQVQVFGLPPRPPPAIGFMWNVSSSHIPNCWNVASVKSEGTMEKRAQRE